VSELKLPSGSAKYVSLQRLETQALGKRIHYSALGAVAYRVYESIPFAKRAYQFYSTNIEPRLRSEQICSDYWEIMAGEFESIKPHIGDDLDTVVGIGPGVAGLEVLLTRSRREAGASPPRIILIDKTGIDPIHFGFHGKAAVYNSLDLSRQSLTMNGHPENLVETIEADDASSLLNAYRGRVDLVTSLIAWGFHFPIDTYLDLVTQLLRPGGRLIMDVRKGTDGKKKLEATFASTTVILDDPKFERVLSVKSRHPRGAPRS
jgi:hypothetical protein